MTTRRSRLKAVANLPVRRKPPAFQDSSDVINCSEKSPVVTPLLSDKTEVKLTTNCSQPEHYSKDTPLSPLKKNKCSDNELDNNNDKKNSAVLSYEATGKIKLTESDLKTCESNVSSNDESEGKDIINESNTSNRSTSCKYKRKAKPNLRLCRPKENFLGQVPKQEDNTIMPLIGTLVGAEVVNENISKISSSSSSGIQETLTLPAIGTEITTLDNNSPINVLTVNSVSDYDDLQSSNQVESRDMFDNFPKLVFNKADSDTNDDIPIDKETSEAPILTTLVNCRADVGCTLSTLENGHETELLIASHNNAQEFCINDTCTNAAVIEIINYPDSDGITRSIISPVRDRELLDSLMYQDSQEVLSLENCNTQAVVPLKRTVTSVKRKRTKCSDFTKKLADARREFQKKYEKTKPDRSTLKMIDLIFYNPATNPMESKNKSDRKEGSLQNRGSIQDGEEDIDEPLPMDCDSNLLSVNDSGTNQRMPVPQVKIGSNGEIILDEKSVIIETTEAKKGREDLLRNSVPIFEDRGSKVNYYRGKTRKTRDWTDFETKRFYKALNTIGPDFSLMQKYFPKRSRMELKNKFKREERLNRSLIDKALINPSEFDMTQLEKDLAVEKRAEEKELEMKLSKGLKEKSTTKRTRTKSSLFSREIVDCNKSGGNQILSNIDNERGLFRNENEKKEKEIGYILRKYLLRDMKNSDSDKSEITVMETKFENSSNHIET